MFWIVITFFNDEEFFAQHIRDHLRIEEFVWINLKQRNIRDRKVFVEKMTQRIDKAARIARCCNNEKNVVTKEIHFEKKKNQFQKINLQNNKKTNDVSLSKIVLELLVRFISKLFYAKKFCKNQTKDCVHRDVSLDVNIEVC